MLGPIASNECLLLTISDRDKGAVHFSLNKHYLYNTELCYNETQWVYLAYIQTGISGVFFGVLNFENLYFLGTDQSCCIKFSSCQKMPYF